MAIDGEQVSVSTSATALAVGTNGRIDDPVPCIVKNGTTNQSSVYIGGISVSSTGSSIGYNLEVGQGLAIQLVNGETIYAIAATGTVVIDVLIGRQSV